MADEGSLRSRIRWAEIAPGLLVSAELVLALLLGFWLTVVGVGGGGWILGGMIAGAIALFVYRFWLDAEQKPNKNARKIGQILVGLTIGGSVKHLDPAALSAQVPIFIILTLFLLASSGIIGYFYSRIGKLDLLTAVFASVPGNLGVMANLAAEYQRNAAIVSLVQLTRFTSVTLLVPLVANVPIPHDIQTTLAPISASIASLDLETLVLVGLLMAIVTVAVRVGTRFQVPAAALFCAIVTGMIYTSVLASPLFPEVQFQLPPIFNLVGQILLGITIGEYWATNPTIERRAIAYVMVPATLTFVAGFLSAAIAKLLTDWDWLTCLLVTAPGGSPEMILIALVLQHNVEVVTVGHLVRLLSINLSIPLLVSLIYNWEQRQPQSLDTSNYS